MKQERCASSSIRLRQQLLSSASSVLSDGCRPNTMFKLTPINVLYGQEEAASPKRALAICTQCFFSVALCLNFKAVCYRVLLKTFSFQRRSAVSGTRKSPLGWNFIRAKGARGAPETAGNRVIRLHLAALSLHRISALTDAAAGDAQRKLIKQRLAPGAASCHVPAPFCSPVPEASNTIM